MKSQHPCAKPVGFTIIELTVVILVLLALAGMSMYYGTGLNDWKKAKDASEKLRSVYSAQKGYLADNPTTAVSTLTPAMVLPYMPNRETALPTATALDGSALTIKVDVSPPVVVNGSGATYDPSGSSNDGQWDVGL
jgi:type II secretory pathway pseudopilin PulG